MHQTYRRHSSHAVPVKEKLFDEGESPTGQVNELDERPGLKEAVECQINDGTENTGHDQSPPGRIGSNNLVKLPSKETGGDGNQDIGQEITELIGKAVLKGAAGEIGVQIDADERKDDFANQHRNQPIEDEDDDLNDVEELPGDIEQEIKVRSSASLE